MASLGVLDLSLVDALADPVAGPRHPVVDAWLASLRARVARAHLKQHQCVSRRTGALGPWPAGRRTYVLPF